MTRGPGLATAEAAVRAAEAQRKVIAAEHAIASSARHRQDEVHRANCASEARSFEATAHAMLEARMGALLSMLASLQRESLPDGKLLVAERVRGMLHAEREARLTAERQLTEAFQAQIATLKRDLELERAARRESEEALRQLVDEVAQAVQQGLLMERKAREDSEAACLRHLEESAASALPVASTRASSETARGSLQPTCSAWRVT